MNDSKIVKHDWFYYKNDIFRSCKKCGYIENKKNTNDECKGKVSITLRGEDKMLEQE